MRSINFIKLFFDNKYNMALDRNTIIGIVVVVIILILIITSYGWKKFYDRIREFKIIKGDVEAIPQVVWSDNNAVFFSHDKIIEIAKERNYKLASATQIMNEGVQKFLPPFDYEGPLDAILTANDEVVIVIRDKDGNPESMNLKTFEDFKQMVKGDDKKEFKSLPIFSGFAIIGKKLTKADVLEINKSNQHDGTAITGSSDKPKPK